MHAGETGCLRWATPMAAALVIQEGGRLVEINELARQMFHIPGGQIPDLEQLARQIKPTELFLELCGQEGHGAVYFRRQGSGGEFIFVAPDTAALRGRVLRALETATIPDAADRTGAFSVPGKSLFPQDFSASLDLQATIQQAFANLKQVIPSDIMEITLWDAERSELEPYYLIGASDAGDGQLQVISTPYRLDEGYSGYLARTRKPLLIPNATLRSDVRPAQREGRFPFDHTWASRCWWGMSSSGRWNWHHFRKMLFNPVTSPCSKRFQARLPTHCGTPLLIERSKRVREIWLQ